MNHAAILAQQEWKKAEVSGSVQTLDEQRGVWAATVLVNGKPRPALHWGPMRMILTDEIIEKLATWNAAQQGKEGT